MRREKSNQRSLVEQLSGIRLVAFLLIAAINLAVLAALCVIPVNLQPPKLNFLLFIFAAIVSLAALTIGSLNVSAMTKITSLILFLTACLWMIRWVSLPSDLKSSSPYACIYIVQALLIFVATTVYWERVAGFAHPLRFSVKDLFLAIGTVAVTIPVLGSVFSDWPIKFLFRVEAWYYVMFVSVTNILWTIAILSWYPKQKSRTRKNQLGVGLVLVAFFTELLVYSLFGAPMTLTDMPRRAIFILWIAISLLPIIGFERSKAVID